MVTNTIEKHHNSFKYIENIHSTVEAEQHQQQHVDRPTDTLPEQERTILCNTRHNVHNLCLVTHQQNETEIQNTHRAPSNNSNCVYRVEVGTNSSNGSEKSVFRLYVCSIVIYSRNICNIHCPVRLFSRYISFIHSIFLHTHVYMSSLYIMVRYTHCIGMYS